MNPKIISVVCRNVRVSSVLGVGLSCLFGLLAGMRGAETSPDFLKWAPRPPMGWNSWDCFATTVTEAQTKDQTNVMADRLASHGWEYVTVDIQWYQSGPTRYDYPKGAALTMDAWGRLLPAPNRF